MSYLKSREVDFANAERALLAFDFLTLKEIGHRIRGGAPLFGFDSLSTLAIQLEQAALSSDAPKIKILVAEFSQMIRNEKLLLKTEQRPSER